MSDVNKAVRKMVGMASDYIDELRGTIDKQEREIERLKKLLLPFSTCVNDRGFDGKNRRLLSVGGRAGNDAYREAWLALNPKFRSK